MKTDNTYSKILKTICVKMESSITEVLCIGRKRMVKLIEITELY